MSIQTFKEKVKGFISRIPTDKSDLHVSDFGNIEIPDLDLSLFDVLNDGYDEETRYTKPKVYDLKSDYVLYDNAVKLAQELRLGFGERADTCLLAVISYSAIS